MENKKIENLLPNLQKNILLKSYTTFKIGGPAKYFFVAKNKKDLIKAVKVAKEFKLPFFILGGGSNVLISDKGFNGLVVNFQFSIFNFQKNKIIAGAGVKLGKLVNSSTKRGLTGLEWVAGIPGTVGGAIRGSAGAFGNSMAEAVKVVEVFDAKNFKIKKLSKKDCQFDYRNGVFKKNKNLIILSAELQLKKGKKSQIRKKIKEYINYRKKSHPREPSAGSVFKNIEVKKLNNKFFKKFPEAKKVIKEDVLPAAFLIAQSNLIGKKIGKAQISQKHPNFIVNLGKARAKDVKKLINLAKKKVKNKFGIELKEEIELL